MASTPVSPNSPTGSLKRDASKKDAGKLGWVGTLTRKKKSEGTGCIHHPVLFIDIYGSISCFFFNLEWIEEDWDQSFCVVLLESFSISFSRESFDVQTVLSGLCI